MHIRPFTHRDIPQATSLFLAGVQTDTLNHYMFNLSLTTSHRARSIRYLQEMLTTRGNQCFVMLADSNESAAYINEPLVVAWAVFTRIGKSEVARKWQQTNPLSSPLERTRSWVNSTYTSLFPGTDPSHNRANFERILPILSDPWSEEVFPEAWVAEGLYVDPAWQRRGISRKLLEWVKVRAREEQVPVIVKGSPIGGLAYRANGFRSVGCDRFGQFFNELEHGGEPHQVWVWEPEGLEEKWFGKAGEWWRGNVGAEIAEKGITWNGEGVVIIKDDPRKDVVKEMLAMHVKEQHGNVPAGFGFAMDAEKVAAPTISFYTMWDKEKLVGMGGLKDLGDANGEVKSLRTVAEYRGKGLGEKMLRHIVNEARSRGWKKVYLETGKISFYDTAAKLYRKVGFEPCGPFSDYAESDHNQFFCFDLETRK